MSESNPIYFLWPTNEFWAKADGGFQCPKRRGRKTLSRHLVSHSIPNPTSALKPPKLGCCNPERISCRNSSFWPDFGISTGIILASFHSFSLHLISSHSSWLRSLLLQNFFCIFSILFDLVTSPLPEILFHFVLWFQVLNTPKPGGLEVVSEFSPWRCLRWISIPDQRKKIPKYPKKIWSWTSQTSHSFLCLSTTPTFGLACNSLEFI